MTESPPMTRRNAVRARTNEVYFDFITLIRAASWLWPDPVITKAAIAGTLGLRPNTVSDMVTNRALHVTLSHFGLMAWYFGVGTDQILRYEPPAARTSTDTIAELERDLAQLDQGKPPASTREALPQLGRPAPPAGHPGAGAIVVVNHIPTLLASRPLEEIAALTGRTKQNIERSITSAVAHVARWNLAELMELFRLENLSELLSVQCNLNCYSDGDEASPDAVRVETPIGNPTSNLPAWRRVDWPALMRRWRALAGEQDAPATITATDVAVIRYVYAAITAREDGRVPRLGGQFASAIQVSRETINNIVTGDFRSEITSLDLPASVQRLLNDALQLPSSTHSAEPADAPRPAS